MRVLHQILNDLTNYPKHDYRGIRGNRTALKLGPDSELLSPLQAKFTVASPIDVGWLDMSELRRTCAYLAGVRGEARMRREGAGNYNSSGGIGLPGRSSSQTMERIHQRLPSK